MPHCSEKGSGPSCLYLSTAAHILQYSLHHKKLIYDFSIIVKLWIEMPSLNTEIVQKEKFCNVQNTFRLVWDEINKTCWKCLVVFERETDNITNKLPKW